MLSALVKREGLEEEEETRRIAFFFFLAEDDDDGSMVVWKTEEEEGGKRQTPYLLLFDRLFGLFFGFFSSSVWIVVSCLRSCLVGRALGG